jgi:hypothetical protein
MPLFRCDKCGCVENTATGRFWSQKAYSEQVLCAECATGKWHNSFPKESADGLFVDENGFLYLPEEVDQEKMEWTYNRQFKMVGRVGQ